MKKIIVLFTALSSFVFANEQELLDRIFPNENATIISGSREAKKNITTIFIYNENASYNIFTRVNNTTTILLSPDEQIISVDAGDTARWTIKELVTGSDEGERSALIIKPLAFDSEKMIRTNLNIFTTKRFYTFSLLSAKDWYNPIIKFLYPKEIQLAKKKKAETEVLEYAIDPTKLNYNYSISTKKYNFAPTTIFSDGSKTYLMFKENLQELPALYMLEGKQLLLLNYRIKGNYMIVDRIFEEGALILGKKKIKIKKR